MSKHDPFARLEKLIDLTSTLEHQTYLNNQLRLLKLEVEYYGIEQAQKVLTELKK